MEDWSDLVRHCRRNDRLAQEKLYQKLYPSMYSLCKKFFQDDFLALEVMNDGFVKVFQQLMKFKSGEGDFFNWVYTVIRNTALDQLRRTVKEVTSVTELREESYEPTIITDRLEWKDIYKFLDLLAPATRAVFSLFYMEDFSIAEIAEQLQISKGTVKWHLSESRRIMKPVLAKHYSI